MNYDQYKQHLRKTGRGNAKKETVYYDVREMALRDAAAAIGLKYETLVAMVENNNGEQQKKV